jgi:hypothetical protein
MILLWHNWLLVLLLLFLSSTYSETVNHECKKEFFTVLADKMPWTGQSEDCTSSFMANRDRLLMLGHALQQMNSSLTIYSTMQNLESCEKFVKSAKVLRIVAIDAQELLETYGYVGKVRKVMDSWKLTGYVRSSDIIRLTLAHRYNQIYIDSDVILLDLNIHWYTKPFVAVNVWQDVENALEISNCAFCLPPTLLMSMMAFQHNRIANGPPEYQYTTFGPSMFHKVIMNQNLPVALYSQNNPKESNFAKIAESIKVYGHKFLHITTAIRKAYRNMNIHAIVARIQQLAGLPMLYGRNILREMRSLE